MAYPRSQRSRGFKSATITSGDFTLSSATFIDLATTADITLLAQVGDVLEVIPAFLVSNATASTAMQFDAQTRVSAAGVNTVSGGLADGVPAWRLQPQVSAQITAVVGSWPYTIVSGDLSSGTVTLRMRYRANNTNVTTVSADATNRKFLWWVKNLGPVSPH